MPKSEAPGFSRKPRADGSTAFYWEASRASRQAAGYPVRTVRLDRNEETAKAECRALTEELMVWIAEKRENALPTFDGTIASLVHLYQKDPDSPYRSVRPNTRVTYDGDLKIIQRTVGACAIDDLTRKDFASWHRTFSAPKAHGGPPRVRRGHGLMTMLRILVGFGVAMRLDGCREVRSVLEEMTFATPERRNQAITAAQAEAIIAKALELGRRSIALGQTLQFELALRQVDVIGRWQKGEGGGGIAFHGRFWGGGLTWADLTSDRLAKRTSKTGQEGEWTPQSYPLIVKAMGAFAEHERVGPAIIDEQTGRPYQDRRYGKVWRPIADAAGIPRDVWNMDSRAGAITEASEAGAQIEDMRQFATHANPDTTRRYIRRTGASTDRVAELRLKHRRKDDG